MLHFSALVLSAELRDLSGSHAVFAEGSDTRSEKKPLVIAIRHDRPIRYDTRCCFNVRSKADMSQLNLPHGTDN